MIFAELGKAFIRQILLQINGNHDYTVTTVSVSPAERAFLPTRRRSWSSNENGAGFGRSRCPLSGFMLDLEREGIGSWRLVDKQALATHQGGKTRIVRGNARGGVAPQHVPRTWRQGPGVTG